MTTPIARLEGRADVLLQDGRRLVMDGLFTQPRTRIASPVAEQLGCALEEGPMGPFVKVAEGQATSVPNVFACGDAARAAGNVAMAVSDGAMAGIGAHRVVPSLVELMTDPLVQARGLAVTRDHEGFGPITTTAPGASTRST